MAKTWQEVTRTQGSQDNFETLIKETRISLDLIRLNERKNHEARTNPDLSKPRLKANGQALKNVFYPQNHHDG